MLSCENSRFSSHLTAGDVLQERTSATQRQKSHTDDVNQCLHNKSWESWGSKGKFVQFYDFGKKLCSSVNELQQNSNASSTDEYFPQILTFLLWIPRVYI